MRSLSLLSLSFVFLFSLFLSLSLPLLPSLSAYPSGSTSCVPSSDNQYAQNHGNTEGSGANMKFVMSQPVMSLGNTITMAISQPSLTIHGVLSALVDSTGKFVGTISGVGKNTGTLAGGYQYITSNTGGSFCSGAVKNVVTHSTELSVSSVSFDIKVTAADNAVFPLTFSTILMSGNQQTHFRGTAMIYQGPSPPTSVNITNPQLNSLDIAWTAGSPGMTSAGAASTVAYYNVLLSPGNIKINATSSPITVTGLTAGTTYTVNVQTVAATGSISSNSASFMAMTSVFASPPLNLMGQSNGAPSVFLSWSAPTTIAQGSSIIDYVIQVEDSNAAPLFQVHTGSAVTFINLTSADNIVLGTTYQFTVTAVVTGNNNGIPSASSGLLTPQINVSPPGDPMTPMASQVTPGVIHVYFTAGSTGGAVNTYTVIFTPVSGDTAPHTFTGMTSPVVASSPTLHVGAFYTVTIQASNSAGKSAVIMVNPTEVYVGMTYSGHYFSPDETSGYNFWWISYPAAGFIDINMTANVGGYIGWGVNEAYTMIGADYIVGWVADDDAEVYVLDMWGQEANYVLQDKVTFLGGADNTWNKQGWQVTVGEVTTTSIAFRRNLTSTDPEYDTDIEGQNVVFWAANEDDCIGETDQCQGHEHQGVVVLSLVSLTPANITNGEPVGTAIRFYSSQDGLFNMTWGTMTCSITPFGQQMAGDPNLCVEFNVSAKSTGYVGVAISTLRSMDGIDAVVGWWDQLTHTGYIMDSYSEDEEILNDLNANGTTDAELVRMSQSNGWTHFTFRRYLVTEDVEFDNMITGYNNMITWAYGYPNDTCVPFGTDFGVAVMSNCEAEYHANQGAFQANLLSMGTPMNAIAEAPLQGCVPPEDAEDVNIAEAMPIFYNERADPVYPTPNPPTINNGVIPGLWRYVSGDNNFAVTWDFYTHNNASYINVTMAGVTNGWIAWGICPTGNQYEDGADQMTECDYWIGWVADDDNEVYVMDMYDEEDFPMMDIYYGGQDDLENKWGKQEGGITWIGFSRLLVTPDVGTSDNELYMDGEYLTEYVYSPKDCDGEYYTCEYHNFYGLAMVNFNTTVSKAHAIMAAGGGAGVYDAGNGFKATYVVDNVAASITITMSAPTAGWIGMGIANGFPTPAASMAIGMDYWIGWVDNGVAYIRDFNSNDPNQPNSNEPQDLKLISGKYENGITTIVFSRLLNTGDPKDNVIVPAGSLTQSAFAPGICPADPNAICSTAHGGNWKASSYNFFTGAQTAVNTDDPIWNAGSALCLGVALFLGAWAALRWTNKLVKKITESMEKRKFPEEQKASQPAMRIQVDKAGDVELKEVTLQDEEGMLMKNPAGVLKRASVMAPAAAGGASPAEQRWRNQWIQLTTDDGYAYFYNEKTFETAWELPPMPDFFEHNPQSNAAPHVRASMVGKKGENVFLPTATEAMRKSIMTTQGTTSNTLSTPGAMATIRASIAGAFQAAQPKYRIPVKPVSPVQQQVQSILEYRLPFTQWSILSVFLICAYIIINAVAVFAVNVDYWPIEKRFGYLAAGNLLVVILPAVRNSLLTMVWGLPFDRIIVFHRFIGRFLLGVVTVHMGLYMKTWSNTPGTSINHELTATDAGKYGFIGWLCLLVINILSLDVIRRRHFNFFYFTHFLFVPLYVLAYAHCDEPKRINTFIFLAVALYALDRFMRFIWSSIPFHTVKLTTKGTDVVQVRFEKHPLAKFLGLYKVGQYVFINFPCMGPREFFAWHPFTLSSGPDEPYGEVHIRGLGNFTKKLHNHVSEMSTSNASTPMWIRVDGPYGNHKLNYRRYPVLMLVAGGIGITPIVALVKDIYRIGVDKNKPNPHSSIESVYVVWIVPEQKIYNWFAEEFDAIWQAAQQPGTPLLSVWIYVTRGESTGSSPSSVIPADNFQFGRPDFDAITNIAVQQNPGKAQIAFACGPEMMVNSLWDASNIQKRNGVRMDFHHETFEW